MNFVIFYLGHFTAGNRQIFNAARTVNHNPEYSRVIGLQTTILFDYYHVKLLTGYISAEYETIIASSLETERAKIRPALQEEWPNEKPLQLSAV